eukprot:CAMPEP_0172158972 /NCGR_PEP_ID=MMETSP1050-20130122/4687_1 /TAXON_ID=233186 /ORGANISM="Cryptomonas curvata, Strain CCAP979/52" /LENGTH=146 /DNA_ID=CAMNT_0012828459 /DNA_START=299 /DNA_END=736 /DNA_ORIENTATION=+
MKGSILFEGLPRFIGDRVLRGSTEKDRGNVIKFYIDKASAEKAVGNKRQIETALGIGDPTEESPGEAVIFEGCGGGLCAVQDKYIGGAAVKISIEHLKNLTEVVSTLYSKNLLHGDLRLPNIIFRDDLTVSLIDFEWAGSYAKDFW